MLKVRQRIGKYRIERKLAEGGFAVVFQAFDTIEGIRVAVKVPHDHLVDKECLDALRKEVRLAASLDHTNILPLKNATFIDDRLVIVSALGEESIGDRLQRRLGMRTALSFAEQMLEAVAYAHRQRVIHCDIKPENFVLFPEHRVRLTDFGIARVANRTVCASGSGTLGYIAPEQAMGKPSLRSDVFSLGLVIYRMFSGQLPEWPFEWPPPGHATLKSRVHADVIRFLQKALEVDPRRRFPDADQMLVTFRRLRSKALKPTNGRVRQVRGQTSPQRDWKTVQRRQFQQQYGRLLETRHRCSRCEGPVSEYMKACPWCGKAHKTHRGETPFPLQCARCNRGMKADWKYCPWCYGSAYEPSSSRQYSDVRYRARCSNRRCKRKLLMPFMRYCPWCHTKVTRKWRVNGSGEKCPSCSWGVLKAFWTWCPWCSCSLNRR